jgi:hypothetical protein
MHAKKSPATPPQRSTASKGCLESAYAMRLMWSLLAWSLLAQTHKAPPRCMNTYCTQNNVQPLTLNQTKHTDYSMCGRINMTGCDEKLDSYLCTFLVLPSYLTSTSCCMCKLYHLQQPWLLDSASMKCTSTILHTRSCNTAQGTQPWRINNPLLNALCTAAGNVHQPDTPPQPLNPAGQGRVAARLRCVGSQQPHRHLP